jgi:hypothetical protein
VTRDPTGYPEADDARGPLGPGPPRPRPPQAGSGPFPVLPASSPGPPDRHATGPLPATSRFPLGVAPPDGEAGSVPGFEFEGRRGRPGPENGRPGPDSGWHGPENGRHGPENGWPRAVPGGADRSPASPNRSAGPERSRETWLDEPGGEPKRFRYTSTVSQPRSAPPQAWPDNGQPAVPGFEFDARTPSRRRAPSAPSAPSGRRAGPRDQPWVGPPPSGPPPSGPPGDQQGTGRAARSDPRTAGAEWTALLRSFLPQPAKRTWFKEFRAGLVFRGWATKVAVPILAMIVFGVAVVVIAGANSGTAGPAPSATALGFPPATLAGADFTAAASGRGVSQSLGQVASDGAEVVAVGSQAGARIPRAQFFISLNDGRSWAMGMERTPAGGEPPPGHAARFVAGGPGAWLAVGPSSIWTSADGRTWTLTRSAGMPLRPGDQISVLRRTASGFLAAGVNVPGGDQAKASPVLFLSANGVSWRRLDATRLGLPAGTGRVLDIKYAAVEGQLILISGDVTTTTTKVVGKAKRTATTVTTVTSGAWLSRDGGSTWLTAVSPAAGPAGPPQITGVAAVSGGFVLVRPATVSRAPALEVYRSANGTAWTLQATLSAPGGLVTGLVDGGPAGAVVTAQAGVTGQAARTLTAFVSATGVSWQQTQAFGRAAGESVSGVAMAGGTGNDAVVTATVAGQDSRQAAISVVAAGAPAVQVNVAKIPGAFDPQLAVNDIAAASGTQIAVGSANGYPAAWTSTDGGSSWTRAVGATPAVFTRAGTQQLISVTHGTGGWLAVGGVTAGAPQHPVVLSSADGTSWQAADGEAAFGGRGLVTVQAAAGAGGYVIVGYQVTANGMIATAWWSNGPAGATGWQGAEVGELAGSSGSTRMQAVTASSAGFVAVGAAGNQASAWTSPDGRTWHQDDLPVPIGSARAVLEHVASNGRTVAAVGTALTTAGQRLPFTASSSNGGATWTESTLPAPSGQASVTALVAAGGSFTATGTFGSTAAHQDVVVWTSANGSAWQAVTPTGQGLTGPGIQAITALTSSGSTMLGVGFTASSAGEQPVFWQTPVR